LLAGCCECGDEPSGSGTTELVVNDKNNHKKPRSRFLLEKLKVAFLLNSSQQSQAAAIILCLESIESNPRHPTAVTIKI
jgi:hypothetical protein